MAKCERSCTSIQISQVCTQSLILITVCLRCCGGHIGAQSPAYVSAFNPGDCNDRDADVHKTSQKLCHRLVFCLNEYHTSLTIRKRLVFSREHKFSLQILVYVVCMIHSKESFSLRKVSGKNMTRPPHSERSAVKSVS